MNRKRQYSLRAMMMLMALSALLALAACGGAGAPEETAAEPEPVAGGELPVLESPVSTQTLEQLALDAWMRAGFDGEPTPVDTSNAAGVGGASVLVADGGLDSAAAVNGFVLSIGATGGLTLPHSANALINGTRQTMKAALTPLTSAVVDVTGTYACPGGGSVTLDGAMVVTSDQTIVPVLDADGQPVLDADGNPVVEVHDGTISTWVGDLVIGFDACASGGVTHRLWGVAVINTDNTIVADQDDAAPDFTDVSLAVNELLEAGLAVEEVATGLRYRLLTRYDRAGVIEAYIDTAAKPIKPDPVGSLTARTMLNGATCSTTVTFALDPDPDTVTSGCTASP